MSFEQRFINSTPFNIKYLSRVLILKQIPRIYAKVVTGLVFHVTKHNQ